MISVIIPTYNREKTLKKSIMSVLNQTYKNIEVIIIDDNSTDNTLDIIKSIDDKTKELDGCTTQEIAKTIRENCPKIKYNFADCEIV